MYLRHRSAVHSLLSMANRSAVPLISALPPVDVLENTNTSRPGKGGVNPFKMLVNLKKVQANVLMGVFLQVKFAK